MTTDASNSPLRLVALICLAEALGMTGFAAYPAFLPTLKAQWQASGAAAGFVGGAFFLGYMLAVPFLSGITDRIDARRVFAASGLLGLAGTGGFALLADGIISAALFQALAGAGLAGTYMPGLKALTDRITGPRQPRYIAFYTATFGIGTSLSLLLGGWLGALLPWREAIGLMALGPLLASAVFLLGVRPQAASHAHHGGWWPAFGPALALGQTRRYILGYAAHCWELFGLRSWLVAFIAFAYGLSASTVPLSATEAAAAINLLGLPASILGNEAAGRLGRQRWIVGTMLAAGGLCWLAGFSAVLGGWLMLAALALYFVAVMADSAALTAGLVAATPLGQRGAAMAISSLLGFGAGFVAPLVFGATLDAAGGGPLAWGLAFASLSLGGLLWLLGSRDKV
ncbi:MAG TPA: MFS transporter [Rhodocyclaceae bacterium]